MRWLLSLSAALVLSVMLGATSARADLELFAPRGTPPEVAFLDRSGDYRGLVEYRGQPVIVLFWATWCPICTVELPKLDRLQSRYRHDQLTVLALSQDRAGFPAVDRFYRRKSIRHLAKYLDEGSILGAFMGIRGVPTTFVLNTRGEVIGMAEGSVDWDSEAMVQQLLRRAAQ